MMITNEEQQWKGATLYKESADEFVRIITPEDVIIEARSWVGTPWLHQGTLKDLGVDCAGFVEGVCVNVGLPVSPDFTRDYKRREDGTVMLQILGELCEYTMGEMRVANVVAFHDNRAKEIPRHLAFVSQVLPQTNYIIHASERGVVEHRMDTSWLRKIHSVWRIRGVG